MTTIFNVITDNEVYSTDEEDPKFRIKGSFFVTKEAFVNFQTADDKYHNIPRERIIDLTSVLTSKRIMRKA